MAKTAVREIGNLVKLGWMTPRPGFTLSRIHGDQLRWSPYLAVDHFYMSQPIFPSHPHAGFSAVTLLFEDSEVSFVNRDSKGDRSLIKPGDLHWTTAAGGIVHEEVPEKSGTPGHGFQIFCNLPASLKNSPARADHLNAEDVPIFTSPDGARVRVLAGTTNGVNSPLNPNLLYPVTLLDVHLPTNSSFIHTVLPTDNFAAVVVKGSVDFGGKVVGKDEACDFNPGRTQVTCRGVSEEPAHVVIFGGAPLSDPVVWHGPFCGVSREQVAQYMRDYQEGKMGRLEPSFQR